MQQRTSKESNSVYQSLMDKIVVTDFRSARKSPRQNRCAPRRAETALRIASSFIIPGRRFLRNGVPRFSTIWRIWNQQRQHHPGRVQKLHRDFISAVYHFAVDAKRVEKISEDFVDVTITFAEYAKICSRGIYQDEEDRIIFCSSEESRAGSALLGCFFPHFQLRVDQRFFQN